MKSTVVFILAASLFFSNVSFSQTFNEIQVELSQAIDSSDTLQISRSYYKLGKFYDQENQIEESKNAFYKALRFADQISNFKAITSISNYLGVLFSYEGESDSAIFYYNKAVEGSLLAKDSVKLSKVLLNIGDEYATKGEFVEAVNNSLRALGIKEALNDSTNLTFYYQKVGEIYKSAGEIEKWEEYVEKAYSLIGYEECTSIASIAAIYNDLGGIAENKGKYDEALMFYDTLITFGKENDYDNAVGVALSNSATIYKLLGDNKKALSLAVESKEFRNFSSYQDLYDVNLLAELYLANENTEEARINAHLVLADEKIDNYPDEKMRAFKTLYEVEKKDKNFEKSLFWNEQYKSLSDSIRDKDVRTQILDMEIAYQTEKKEKQIELLTTENKLKNQRLQAGIILLLVLIAVILLILYVLRIRKNQALLIQTDLQQQVLRSQMNPHFMFNVLGSIQNFMLSNDNTKAASYLSQYATLVRSTLEYSSEETISLFKEIEMLKNYIDLEQMRIPGKFSYRIVVDDDLEVDFITIPPMMIQPFVENAIKHGFKQIDYPGELIISVKDKTDWVEFIIEDNGFGLTENNSNNGGHRSMAMQIFEKRRKLIQQKYKKEFTFKIVDLKEDNASGSGVIIIINVPILEND